MHKDAIHISAPNYENSLFFYDFNNCQYYHKNVEYPNILCLDNCYEIQFLYELKFSEDIKIVVVNEKVHINENDTPEIKSIVFNKIKDFLKNKKNSINKKSKEKYVVDIFGKEATIKT